MHVAGSRTGGARHAVAALKLLANEDRLLLLCQLAALEESSIPVCQLVPLADGRPI